MGTLLALIQCVERAATVGYEKKNNAEALQAVIQEAVHARAAKNQLVKELKEWTDMEDIIRALKCSTEPGKKDCGDCPYQVLEPIDPKFPIPADVEIDGVGYWRSCDYDSMAWDAAHVLEILKI